MNLKKAAKELGIMRKKRGEAFGLKQDAIALCSQGIRALLTGKKGVAGSKASQAWKKMQRASKVMAKWPSLQHRVLTDAYQEYVELMVLKSLLEGRKPPELKVPPEAYITGCLDAIGETKRAATDLLLHGKAKEAWKLYYGGEELYRAIEGMAFPGSLVPGMKPKQDAMKRSLEGFYAMLAEYELRRK